MPLHREARRAQERSIVQRETCETPADPDETVDDVEEPPVEDTASTLSLDEAKRRLAEHFRGC